MPLYQDVITAAVETVEKMLTARGIDAGKVTIDTTGGETASMERHSYGMALHMPTLAPDAWLTRGQADRMVGYLVHEAAHLLHTAWPEWLAACKGTEFVRNLTNAFEDLRIERLEQAGPFKGFASAMAMLINHMDTEATAKAAANGVVIGSKAAHLPWAFALIGRSVCNGLAIPGAAQLRQNIAPELTKALEFGLRGATLTSSCADCHKLALKVAKMVEDAKRKAQQQPQPPQPQPQQPQPPQPQQTQPQDDEGQGEACQDGPPGQDEGQGQDAPQGQDEGEDQGQDEGEGEGQGGNQPSQDEGQPNQQGGQAGGAGTYDTDQLDAPSPDLGQGNDVQGEHRTMPDKVANIASSGRYSVVPTHWRHAWTSPRAFRDLMPKSASMADQISQLVAAREVRQLERRLTAGRFDRRAMARAGMGATDVYARRHVTPGVDTAVCILLDLSSSMTDSNDKLSAAKCMALHLADAIDQAGAKVAVLGMADKDKARSNTGCTLIPLKGFNQSMASASNYIAAACNPYGTPLSHSIIAASRWMLGEVDADRYLLLALTDGECNTGDQGVQLACRTATKLGVEPCGLGVQMDVSNAFKGYPNASVRRLADLPKAAMRQLLGQLQRDDA